MLTAVVFIMSSDSTIRIILLVIFVLSLLMEFIQIKDLRDGVKTRQTASRMATELAGDNMRLERLDKMKTEFVSVASHQLRSPLTSIRGYVSMILEGSYGHINNKTREALERVADATANMSLSVEDYLNVSRIEAGNMKYEFATINLKEEIEKLVALMIPVGVKNGVPLVFKSSVRGTVNVRVDVGKSRQIVQNLIDNAFKYTKDKGLVTVTLIKNNKEKRAEVSVIDQGIGIAEEDIKSIFGKFERAQNASKTNVTGAGLGLYIAKAMAEAMGGNIFVTSEGLGKGSTFTVVFPLS